jgi:hypothetical protein
MPATVRSEGLPYPGAHRLDELNQRAFVLEQRIHHDHRLDNTNRLTTPCTKTGSRRRGDRLSAALLLPVSGQRKRQSRSRGPLGDFAEANPYITERP